MHRRHRALAAALTGAFLLAGCASVHTIEADVDTLSFSPYLGLGLLVSCVLLLVPGVFFLFTPPHPGAARGPRKGGGALLILFGLALGVIGVWRLSWRIDLHPDRIVLRSLFGSDAIPYNEVQEVKVREYQNRWRPGTLWVTIVLVRTDGTELSLPYTTLSPDHQKYLEDVLSAHHGDRGGGGDGPIVSGGYTGEPPVVDVGMESRPPVAWPMLATDRLAFCTVCGQKKRMEGINGPSFTCSKCHRRIELKFYAPPRLAYLGVSGGKALVEKDGVEFSSSYGEEAVPGTGILNEGYRNEEKMLILSRVEKVGFTDFRKDPIEEVVRDVKLQWELTRE